MPDRDSVAARMLEGRELPNGWRVVERLAPSPGATGANFSVGYIAERNGTRAYVKALDYSFAFASGDVARVLEMMTSAFNFEVDVLGQCAASHMDRIVRSLDHGQIEVPEAVGVPNVSYLVFELADGDIRHALESLGPTFDYAWALRALHHAATGLWQLHRAGMAHQDVKPSNLLTFGPSSSKLGDLGRASRRGAVAPHDEAECAGDPVYAPPELLYGEVASDWARRRQACDVYLLGSLTMFMFTGATMTAALRTFLPPEQSPEQWTGSYPDVLPYVRLAFDQAVEEFAEALPASAAESLAPMVRQLCDPDPDLRGHPRTRAARHANPYSLERYVSEFNLLARRAEIGLIQDI